MKRKIALFNDQVSFLGSGNDREQSSHIPDIAQSLAQMGYQVDIFTCTARQLLPYDYEWHENIRVIHVPEGAASAMETSLTELMEVITFIIKFCSQQEKLYDLIHANFGSSGLVAAEIKSRLGIPFVLTFQSDADTVRPSHENRDSIPQGRAEIHDRIVREADGILANTAQDRQDLISLYHADPTYIVQIPSGTYPAEGSAWRNDIILLAEFYENVLAVRRVAVSQGMPALYLPSRSEHAKDQIELMDHAFESALQSLQETRARLGSHILAAANLMIECLSLGGKIIVCGDGASVGIARHFSADLIRRGSLPAISLIDDTSLLTDELDGTDYDGALARQVEAVGRSGDLLVGIAIHGYTGRLVRAFQSARAKDIRCISLLGEGGWELKSLSDVILNVPGHGVERVLEVQMLILHILCDLVREHMHPNPPLPMEPLFDSVGAITMSRRLVE